MCNVRVNQTAFRDKILRAYDSSCCITGIHEPQMLRASHIKPWCESTESEKIDVHNGLCLNALHDCAFDCGIITVTTGTYKIKLSSKIEDMMDEKTYDDYFRKYDDTEIIMPHPESKPLDGYLEYHNRNIFEKKHNRVKVVYEMTIDQLY
jgi:putative restriction endonuclease